MKIKSYIILLLIVILFLKSDPKAFATQEENLKFAPWLKVAENKVTLKGNVSENIQKVKPQTGIGVIGLRFIHQVGYPSYIEQVYPNSPASRAGIKVKDLIVAIDDVSTDRLESNSVFELLSGTPGTKVKILITRGSTMFNVELVREDLANFSSDIQNRYLSGPISVPFDFRDLFPYH